MNIPLIIRDLLLRSDQLVIPGLGTFRVIHRPARISRTTQLLLPPSKDITFDSQQKSGDNQLLLSVKKKLGLSEPETSESLKKFITGLEEEISVRGNATIEGVGQLKRDNAGKLSFEPLDDLLNLTGMFALPKLEIPVPAAVETPIPSRVHSGANELRIERKRSRWRVPAAIVVVLALLASLFYFTGIYRNFTGAGNTPEPAKTEDKNPGRIVFGNRESLERDTLQEAISRQLDEKTARENALRFEENRQKKAEESAVPSPAREITPAGPYHIISGAFTVPNNAEKQQSALRNKGLNPQLLPHTGKYYMVSLGGYSTREEAAAALVQLHEKLDQELWVMKIK